MMPSSQASFWYLYSLGVYVLYVLTVSNGYPHNANKLWLVTPTHASGPLFWLVGHETFTQIPSHVTGCVACPAIQAAASCALTERVLQARYRPGLPLVLKGLTFSIPSGSTCGIVGRTGSGKSSLLLALFDLFDIVGGRVLLDGVDLALVSLQQLRRQIAIIPQEPLLFSGSRSLLMDSPQSRLLLRLRWQIICSYLVRYFLYMW
jgi:ABC-type multidrug transport system fused ATPase/permease subunit